MKSKKGFTLIELLAIIIILALIAVIVTPIILNIIEEARISAATDSAYGYKQAVENYLTSRMLDDVDFEYDDIFVIENGKLIKNATYEIPISGTIPKNGFITIENRYVKRGCMTINKYAVTIEDETVVNTQKGECTIQSIITASQLIYDNTKSGSKCTNIQCTLDELYQMLGK